MPRLTSKSLFELAGAVVIVMFVLWQQRADLMSSTLPVSPSPVVYQSPELASASSHLVQGVQNHLKVTVASVAAVIDGDTIKLATGQKVRYIGIDTPETVAPGKPVECGGREAKLLNEALVQGKNVWLEQDLSETDRYDRLLRYVWLASPSGQASDAAELMVNARLVSAGWAVAKVYQPDSKYQVLFAQLEQTARTNSLGLWSEICKI